MANGARVHAAERGVDLTHSVLIAFGGNGPLHAADVARKVGIKTRPPFGVTAVVRREGATGGEVAAP